MKYYRNPIITIVRNVAFPKDLHRTYIVANVFSKSLFCCGISACHGHKLNNHKQYDNYVELKQNSINIVCKYRRECAKLRLRK